MAHPSVTLKARQPAPKALPPHHVHPPITQAQKAPPENVKLFARSDARRPSALHAKKAPPIKPPSIDDHLRKECLKKFDFDHHGGMDGLREKRPTLIRVTHRVASLTDVPFNYLIASLYAESNLKASAVNGEARGMAQSMRIAWDQLKKDQDKQSNFKKHWDQLAPGQKLPSGPGQSPLADILFMAVWTLKREEECSGVASLDGQKKEMARRLCYKLQGKAKSYVDDLKKNGHVVFKDPQTNTNWQTFIQVLKAATPAE